MKNSAKNIEVIKIDTNIKINESAYSSGKKVNQRLIKISLNKMFILKYT